MKAIVENEVMAKIIKNELAFCDSINCEKNEHGNFIYQSSNGKESFNLPFMLLDYKNYLIENKLIKEL
jgi:hypothetical protein